MGADDLAVGIDIGGTWTRAGIVNGNHLTASVRFATGTAQNLSLLTARLIEAVTELRERGAGSLPIGIAVAGLIDSSRREIRRSVNLPHLQGSEFLIRLEEAFGQSCCLVSDADAATWGEYRAIRPVPPRFIHLRFGTGIACGIIIEDEFEPLDPGRTTHWQKLCAPQFGDVECLCGLRGCLEAIASGRAIEQAIASGLGSLSLPDFDALARRGDAVANRILNRAVDATQTVLRSLTADYTPDTVVLGGGLFTALPQMAVRLLNEPPMPHPARIKVAQLGDDAGLIGAAALARNFRGRETVPKKDRQVP